MTLFWAWIGFNVAVTVISVIAYLVNDDHDK